MRSSLCLSLLLRHLHFGLKSCWFVDQRLTLLLLNPVFLSIFLQSFSEPPLLGCSHHQKVEFLRLDLDQHAEFVVTHVDDSFCEFLEVDAGQKFMDLLVAIYVMKLVLFCSLISLSKIREDYMDICFSPADGISSVNFILFFSAAGNTLL